MSSNKMTRDLRGKRCPFSGRNVNEEEWPDKRSLFLADRIQSCFSDNGVRFGLTSAPSNYDPLTSGENHRYIIANDVRIIRKN